MSRSVKIATGFPSASKAAKTLGVSKRVAEQLSSLAQGSRKTGEYVIAGFGRLARVKTTKRSSQGSPIRIRATKVVKFTSKAGSESKPIKIQGNRVSKVKYRAAAVRPKKNTKKG